MKKLFNSWRGYAGTTFEKLFEIKGEKGCTVAEPENASLMKEVFSAVDDPVLIHHRCPCNADELINRLELNKQEVN